MNRISSAALTAVLATAAAGQMRMQPASQAVPAASDEWPTYGHDPGGMRFSPLTQISAANVAQLKVAWTYHMRPQPEPGREPSSLSGSETTPIVAGGMMYISTPYNRVVALDPATGK